MYSIIRKDGTEYGPISAEMLKDWLGSNLLDEQTKIRRVSETEWTTIGALPEFTEHLPPPPPPLLPPKPYFAPISQPAVITPHSLVQPVIRESSGEANDNNLTDDQSTEAEEDALLASRWQRFGASLIDSLILFVPTFLCVGGVDPLTHPLEGSAATGFVALLFITFNGIFLVGSAQTIGKKIIGIQIVDLNGDRATVQKHLGPRYAFYLLAGLIPVAGPFISLINILVIFGTKKRCLHDFLAGTKVVSISRGAFL